VDLAFAAEPRGRVSVVTHGMTRCGRGEFGITESAPGSGSLDLALSMAGWMLAEPDKQLPTGDTVGRSADEKLRVQRVPNPTGSGPAVIRLDLP